jgi:hypothetical protein
MDVSKEKYIMANIKIPIEIIENNRCRLFIDSLHIDFTSISELPESITDPVIKEQTQDTLHIFFKAIFPEYSEYNISNVVRGLDSDLNNKDKQKDLQKDLNKENILELYVENDEIKKMKKPTNITFKIYNKNSRKQYTSKNYDNNGR